MRAALCRGESRQGHRVSLSGANSDWDSGTLRQVRGRCPRELVAGAVQRSQGRGYNSLRSRPQPATRSPSWASARASILTRTVSPMRRWQQASSSRWRRPHPSRSVRLWRADSLRCGRRGAVQPLRRRRRRLLVCPRRRVLRRKRPHDGILGQLGRSDLRSARPAQDRAGGCHPLPHRLPDGREPRASS